MEDNQPDMSDYLDKAPTSMASSARGVDFANIVASTHRRGKGVNLRAALSQRTIGEVMRALGLLSHKDIARVLAYQQRKGRAFGEIALKLRLISRKQLQDALAIHFGHPYTSSESSGVSRDLVVVRDPFGPYAEELRTVAQRLMTSWWTRENNRLAITSPAAGEGRSHVTANLAVVLNQFGHRVLLIDADLRRSRQHEIFGLSLNPGLSRMLCGVAPQEVLRTAPFLPGLDIITAGPAAPNAADLLARDQFAGLIKQAGEFYDVVLLDTPPGIGSVDAEIIAACAGSALTVAAEDLSRVRAVRELTKRLERRQVRIAGLLMNRPR